MDSFERMVLHQPPHSSFIMFSQQYAVFSTDAYVCITIYDGTCEITISPWTTEVPIQYTAKKVTFSDCDEVYTIDEDDSWTVISNDDEEDNSSSNSNDDAIDRHIRLHWTACVVPQCPHYPDCLKSYQTCSSAPRRQCSLCSDKGHTSTTCTRIQVDSFYDELEADSHHVECGYCGKSGHCHYNCDKKMANEYMQQWTA